MTAVLDGIKDGTAQLKQFERELIIQQAELDGWIEGKRAYFASRAAQKVRISMNLPTLGAARLPAPPLTSRGRSSSPDKYLQALRHDKPSILNFALAEFQGDIPQSVSDFVAIWL